jgi:uncharacterized protein
MQIESDVLETLLEMQALDIEAKRLNKQLEALPQRKTILDARTKRRAIQGKAEQVEGLLQAANQKLKKLSDEDDGLAEKQSKIQAEIDEVKGDFRSVQARTKELAGITKRRETLEGELAAADAEIEKILGIKGQVDSALSKLDANEKAATELFVAEGGKLKQQAAAKRAEREQLSKEVPAEVLKVYERTAAGTGRVPLAKLTDEETCGACRAPIDHGRIVDMRGRGNIGTCPSCTRLLILQD